MNLETIRSETDKIDDAIAELFEKRLKLVESVAQVKRETRSPIFSPSREREIIGRLTKNHEGVSADYLKLLFTTLFDISRSHQIVLTGRHSKTASDIDRALKETPQLFPKSAEVACQGTEGANSTFACEKLFKRPTILYFNNFDSVFNAVDKGLCRYGILPVENSLYGSVTHVYDQMKKNNFYIVRSVKLKINHTLLAKPEVKLSDVKVVYSHEQALAQCSLFLRDRDYEIQVHENTALAAKYVAESPRTDIAAIASANCAELYGLDILDDNVQNSENNYTRFICISKKLEIYPGARRISLVVTIPHRPGSLYQLMTKFSTLGINLVKLESRPIPGRDFEFMFYFDVETKLIYDADEAVGSVHDFKLCKDSLLFLADSGYQGILEYHEFSLIPIKRSKKRDLTEEEKAFNKELSRRRIVIENINAKIKVFKIMSHPCRNHIRRHLLRTKLVCAILNAELA